MTAKQTTIVLARAGVIAALYAALTIAFSFTSFATYTVQFRVSEVLTVLPLFFAEAVPGLWIGCMLGNIISGNVVDIFFGSLATLIAAGLTFLIGKLVRGRLLRILLGILPPVFVNMFMVPMTYTLFAANPPRTGCRRCSCWRGRRACSSSWAYPSPSRSKNAYGAF